MAATWSSSRPAWAAAPAPVRHPVIARAVREQGILTVGVVTKPFHFEGTHRMRVAEGGLAELQQYVDTLLVIPNQNLFRLANERTTFADAFKLADNVLHMGVRGVTDLMVMPGLINLDFADIRTVMSEMGKAMMGTGEADGERRAVDAAEAAISNPLLDEVSMKGARGVLINITGGMDMTLFEVDEAANRVREEVDPEANIIVGSTLDESMDGQMRVSVVATGIDAGDQPAYGHSQGAAEPQPTAAPTFRLRPQGQQPAPGQEPQRAPQTSGMTDVKPMTPSSPDGGFSPDQPAGMSSAGSQAAMTPGLRRLLIMAVMHLPSPVGRSRASINRAPQRRRVIGGRRACLKRICRVHPACSSGSLRALPGRSRNMTMRRRSRPWPVLMSRSVVRSRRRRIFTISRHSFVVSSCLTEI